VRCSLHSPLIDAAPNTRILVVCTGNVCRSPLAERLLAHQLRRRSVGADVSSAGLVLDGAPASPEILRLLEEQGLDGTAHRSRILGADLVAGADLILGMTREHVREAVLVTPEAFARTFTLKELVRRGRAVGPRPDGESLAEWLERVGEGRRRGAALGASPDDDITDPIGLPMAVYRDVAREIQEHTSALVNLAWPTY
jgi:protein-tyrosine phosphatase